MIRERRDLNLLQAPIKPNYWSVQPTAGPADRGEPFSWPPWCPNIVYTSNNLQCLSSSLIRAITEMLPALQPCWAAAAACTSLWARLAPCAATYIAASGSKRGLASGTAAAAPAAPWRQRFEGVAPGSVLRVDLPESSVHLSVQVGEHEAVDLSSNTAAGQLAATQAPHKAHAGASIGEYPAAVPVSAPPGCCCWFCLLVAAIVNVAFLDLVGF